MRITMLIAFAAGLALGASSPPLLAQQYPSKPIRFVVAGPAGSASDALLRAFGLEMTKSWGQPLVPDNRPGANTIIAAEACAKSPADGYNFCLIFSDTLSIVPVLYSKIPFDPVKDFDPVSKLVVLKSAIALNAAVSAGSFTELTALAKSKPGVLNYGSLGPGSTPHLFMEWLKLRTGTNLTHVPYKAAPPLVQALVANEVQVSYFGVANLLGHIRAGKLKAVAVTGQTRSPLLPEVPTLSELGITGFDEGTWFGVVAPAGTPKDMVSKMQLEIARVFALPAFREKFLVSQGLEPVANTPADFERSLRSERESYAKLLKPLGIRLD